MALIDIDDFKQALGGVGSIYPDALLESVMEAAENVVLPFLTFDRIALNAYKVESNVVTVYTLTSNTYVVGQQVNIENVHAQLNGNQTITARNDYSFSYTDTHADTTKRPLIPHGTATLHGQDTLYDADERVRLAALMIAVDIWQARISASGVGEQIDFTPGSYRMGRSLLSRVIGLLQGVRDVRGMIG